MLSDAGARAGQRAGTRRRERCRRRERARRGRRAPAEVAARLRAAGARADRIPRFAGESWLLVVSGGPRSSAGAEPLRAGVAHRVPRPARVPLALGARRGGSLRGGGDRLLLRLTPTSLSVARAR